MTAGRLGWGAMLWLLLLPSCRLLRPATIGVGPGAVIIPEGGQTTLDGAVILDSRSIPGADKPFGFTSRSTLTFHDTQATVNLWRWYLDGPAEPVDPTLKAMWYTLLFPSLLVAPLAGSSSSQGYGLILQPDPRYPYAEAGVVGGYWIRPSSPDLKVDVTLGTYIGTGITLGDHLDLALRTTIETPVFHALAGDRRQIVTGGLMLSVRREALIRPRRARTVEEPPPVDGGEDVGDTGDFGDTGEWDTGG